MPNGTTILHNNTAPGVSSTEVVRWAGVGGAPPTTPPPVVDGSLPDYLVPGTVDIRDRQSLQYSRFGSTTYVFPPGATNNAVGVFSTPTSHTAAYNAFHGGSMQTNALDESNSSMTQSVPELSLAQKLFSALTRVLQIHYTNLDSTLNVVR